MRKRKRPDAEEDLEEGELRDTEESQGSQEGDSQEGDTQGESQEAEDQGVVELAKKKKEG